MQPGRLGNPKESSHFPASSARDHNYTALYLTFLESDTVGLKLRSSRLHASPLRTEIALYPPSHRSLLFPNTLAQLRWTQGFPHYAPWNPLVFEMTSW